MRSIRTRLLLGLLASVCGAQVIIYMLIYARIEDEIDDLFDAELERSAVSVYITEPRPMMPLPDRNVQNPQQDMVIVVWAGAAQRPTYQSRQLDGIPRDTPPGFSKLMIAQRQWRLFARAEAAGLVVAAQPADIRDVAARQITWRAIGPSVAVLPFAAWMIWVAISYGLRPLARITRDLRSRSHRDLSPIGLEPLAPDLIPVAGALNELMQRLACTIDSQRIFIADAAHELLTPLTALKLQAQMLARSKSPLREREAMAELQGGISRTLTLARQLLTVARHDTETSTRYDEPIDLSASVQNSVAIHMPMAQEKRLRMEIDASQQATVRGNDEALAILISNLVDNSVKYTAQGGIVRIGIHRATSGDIELRVEDSGPGIPIEERERVFDRFYRRRDVLVSGNGLGLAIAKDIAIRCQATIELTASRALGGLSASVFFPSLRLPGAA